MLPARLFNIAATIALLAVITFLGLVGFRLTRAQVTAEVYRQRLVQMSDDYETLRLTYNQAVRRTAVTELIVQDGTVSVRIRTIAGEEQLIRTPFDPKREIYVDYIVLDGRLWIRRVFDDHTAPQKAVIIDPQLADIDWNSAGVAHGKAAYRRLDEGRWIVTVTGDGSIALARRPDDAPLLLSPPPPIRDYEQIHAEARTQADAVTIGSVLRHLLNF